MVRFADIFPVGMTWNSVPPKKTLDPKAFQSIRDRSFLVKLGDGRAIRILGRISTMTPSKSACPARNEDMSCAVHGAGKPGACLIAPLGFGMPIDFKYDRLPPMFAKCPSEAFTGSPLLRRGVVVDPEFKRHVNENRKQLSGDVGLIEVAFAQQLQHMIQAGYNRDEAILAATSVSIFDAPQSDLVATSGIWSLIVAAVGKGRMSKPLASDTVRKQIAVCDRYRAIWSHSDTAHGALASQIEVLNGVLEWIEK